MRTVIYKTLTGNWGGGKDTVIQRPACVLLSVTIYISNSFSEHMLRFSFKV